MNNEILHDYLTYLKTLKNLSFNSISAYQNDLTSFLTFTQKDIKKITEEDIYKYITYLSNNELSSKSINRKITSLKMFYKYLIKEKIVSHNIILNIARPKREISLPNYLTIEEVDKLLDIPLKDYYDYRNKAMLELAYATGVRVSELIKIKISDLDFYEDYLTVVGKGNKERIIPVGDMALKYVKLYLDNYRLFLVKKDVNDYLFLNSRGLMMTRQGFFKILKEIAFKALIKKNIYPHILRHSFASHLLDNGASLMVIKELLGHENIETTGIYTHISIKTLKENYNNYHPHSKK